MDYDSFTRLFKCNAINVVSKDNRIRYYFDDDVMYRELTSPYRCCHSIHTIKMLYMYVNRDIFAIVTNLSRNSKRCIS